MSKLFRVILLATTILSLLVTSSISADIETLRIQAEAGDADAQFGLGLSYASGSGIQKDVSEAARWYRKAAEQGHNRAAFALGNLYDHGKGVPQDYLLSYFWFSIFTSRCSEMAYTGGVIFRDAAAKKLTPDQLMEAQRMTREWEKSHPRK
jgi:uncharacterized protein